MSSEDLRPYARLSVAAALATIALKGVAWWLTGSVGLLSDAIESFVNLAGALMALAMLTLAAAPPDRRHHFGHGKAEYFSSAFEGILILAAAAGIAITAIDRLLAPRPLESVGVGVAVSIIASLINLATARVLMSAGQRHHSITLEADAHHLMTDVWTSVGVIVAIGLVALTGWSWLDPVTALVVATNIIWTAWQLLKRSAAGLMDVSLPEAALDEIESILDRYRAEGLDFHGLRTRQSGRRTFIALHILVPGTWTVQTAHDWSERIEADLRRRFPLTHLTTHLEPREDPRSIEDADLDRGPG